jgi:intergrase/recombinase
MATEEMTHVDLYMERSLQRELDKIARREKLSRTHLMLLMLRSGVRYASTASVIAPIPINLEEETLANMTF